MAQGYFNPDEDLDRRRALAEALYQQSSQANANPGQMVSGHYVQTPLQSLAAALKTGLSGYAVGAVNKQADDRRQQYAKALTDFYGADEQQPTTPPVSVSNAAGSGPQMNAEGMEGPGAPVAPTATPMPPQRPQSRMDRLLATGNIGLISQLAPGVFEHQQARSDKMADRALDRADNTMRPATAEDKARYGLDPRTPALIDPLGNIKPITDPNQITAYQNATIAHQNAMLGETSRHDRATEANARETAGANNPFGKGMTGKAYAILAQGQKNPAIRETPEYMTAWQILSNPKVDPTTGTIVVPDLSAYTPPNGMGARQGNQQRMPSIQAFAPPNPSQGEAASAGYANRLAESAKLIGENEGALSDFSQNMKYKTPVLGNFMVSPEFQKGNQAERNFINAQLRRESGAAIADSEFENARRQYIPQPGDSAEVKAQKKAARDMAVQNMQLSAGNTLLPPGVIQQASPPRGAPMVPQQQGFGQPTPQQRVRKYNPATGQIE
jgi:hypothetical protein